MKICFSFFVLKLKNDWPFGYKDYLATPYVLAEV